MQVNSLRRATGYIVVAGGKTWLLARRMRRVGRTSPGQRTIMNANMKLNSPLLAPDKVFDVRPIPCSIKHRQILQVWHQLAVGEHFILLNDHDPVPLRYQFAAEFPEAFTWDYLERGPEDFRVKISKTRLVADTSDFTGKITSCGHHH